ncbi:MAG: amidase, partial [Chloroflexota bacterium]
IAAGRPAELTADADRVLPYTYEVVTARDYLRALRVRRVIAHELDALCARYDALVAPTLPSVAPPADVSFLGVFRRPGVPIGAAGNVAG